MDFDAERYGAYLAPERQGGAEPISANIAWSDALAELALALNRSGQSRRHTARRIYKVAEIGKWKRFVRSNKTNAARTTAGIADSTILGIS